jgi:hypothetical protein
MGPATDGEAFCVSPSGLFPSISPLRFPRRALEFRSLFVFVFVFVLISADRRLR